MPIHIYIYIHIIQIYTYYTCTYYTSYASYHMQITNTFIKDNYMKIKENQENNERETKHKRTILKEMYIKRK